MPNGKPGDDPITDLLVHGLHPFPLEVEPLLLEIFKREPRFPDDHRFGHHFSEQERWMQLIRRLAGGQDVEYGRAELEKVLSVLRAEGEADL